MSVSDESTPPSHEFFQQLADGAPVMIWMSGMDMGCFYFNQAWLDFRGRTLQQEFGNGWAEGVHPEDLQRCVNHYVSCFERRLAFAMTYRLKDHAGDYRWILDRGAPHYLPDKTFLGFFGGCADIETTTATVRNAQLRGSLTEMRDFAQRLAVEEISLRAKRTENAVPLQLVAKNLHEQHLEQLKQLQHAAGQMEQLASDMLAYGEIARGACVP
jgi:PAS domain S-box-containing protein